MKRARRWSRALVPVLAVALLAAPVAASCCDSAAAVAGGAPCGMDGMDDMAVPAAADAASGRAHEPSHAAVTAGSHGARPLLERAPCHGASGMSGGCCEPSLAPDARPASLLDHARLAPVRAADARLTVAPPPAARPDPGPSPPRAARLHELGLYTLFSSLLL